MAQTDKQTDTHTHGHGDSMTNSAQWNRVGENLNIVTCFFFLNTTPQTTCVYICIYIVFENDPNNNSLLYLFLHFNAARARCRRACECHVASLPPSRAARWPGPCFSLFWGVLIAPRFELITKPERQDARNSTCFETHGSWIAPIPGVGHDPGHQRPFFSSNWENRTKTEQKQNKILFFCDLSSFLYCFRI